MSSQTSSLKNSSLNHNSLNSQRPGSARAVVGNASDVVHDITELAELQGKLFVEDLKATGKKVAVPLCGIALGLCAALGAVPVLLFGIAELFESQFSLSRSAALFASGCLGALIAVAGILLSLLVLRKSFDALENSTTELKRNLAWIKTALRTAGNKPG